MSKIESAQVNNLIQNYKEGLNWEICLPPLYSLDVTSSDSHLFWAIQLAPCQRLIHLVRERQKNGSLTGIAPREPLLFRPKKTFAPIMGKDCGF